VNRFWPVAVRPLLELVEARSVIEIGAAGARHSRLITDWCREHGARATIIDPAPRFAPEELHDPGSGIVVDQRPSLEALPELDACDVALVDGDHNHYTVLRELRLLVAAARAADRPAPVIVCHDVLWPYARRDLYYDPSRIPDAHRHPWRRAGIVPGRSDLVEHGGLNQQLCNAEHEGGPGNGVLTAIEDAIAQLDEPATLTVLPALYGLAIVTPAARRAATPALEQWLERWSAAEGLRELLELTERARRNGDMTTQALTAAPRGRAGHMVQEVRGRSFRPALDPAVLGRIQSGVMRTTYRDIRCLKSPFDLVLYQQLVDRLKPGTIIEIGAKDGGSALWFADQQQSQLLAPNVVAVDLECAPAFEDHRIRFLQGDALELGRTLTPELLQALPRPWLVVEDSAHTHDATRAVLEFFDAHLQPGDYIVVEDGVLADFPDPAYDRYDDGPNRAVADFLSGDDGRYEIDVALCDHFGHNLTWSPNAWLRRS